MSPFAPVLLGPSEVERGTASLAWGKRNWIQDVRAPESSFSPLSHVASLGTMRPVTAWWEVKED